VSYKEKKKSEALQSEEATSPPVEKVEIKEPLISGVLGLLCPGLGQIYQGRWQKGLLFLVCVLGTFLYGCYLTSSRQVGLARAVYPLYLDGGNKNTLQFFCQVGMGAPVAPMFYQKMREDQGKETVFSNLMASPRLPESSADIYDETKPPTLHMIKTNIGATRYDMGLTYTMIAGLLNLLVIYEAIAGPVLFDKKKKKKKKKKDEDEDEEEEKA